jgi:hypothetical protein
VSKEDGLSAAGRLIGDPYGCRRSSSAAASRDSVARATDPEQGCKRDVDGCEEQR